MTVLFYQRMPIARATIWSILAAMLLLPVGTTVDLPLLPPLNKASLPNLAAFFACRFILGKRIKLLPNLGWVKVLLFVYILSPFFTALLNPDPIIAGPVYIKSMEYYDALSAVIRQLIFIIPFLLGMNFLANANDHEEIVRILLVAGVVYSFPMLFEVRLSPQLHTWIYGYFPHSFIQQIRNGGFRPIVFMGHGLWVAFFTMSAVTAAALFNKIRRPVFGYSPGMVLCYLGVVLFFCKSLASMIYAMFLVPVIYFIRPIQQLKLAKLIVIFVVVFPLLRIADYFPSDEIATSVSEYNQERAESLQFRFDNENLLLTRARKRLFFGWGSWGRNRVYDERTGKDLVVTDGRWIIVLGEYGLIGYIAEFGLLALSVFRSSRGIRFIETNREKIIHGGLTLLMAISMVDLLPNSSVTPWTWLLAGSLIGRSEQLKLKSRNSLNGMK